jgi:Colicin V production protein
MILNILCVVIILAVAYAMANEGLFAAVVMTVNVLLAGVLTYSFWEPTADFLESMVAGTFAAGLEDHLAMMILFALFLGGLRLTTNTLTKTEVDFNPNLHRFGGGLVGLVTGYLLAGFLVCAMTTLPLSGGFMGFTPARTDEPSSTERGLFPPDRVWTSLMRRAGISTFSWKTQVSDTGDPYDRYRTFDQNATFELRYLRYRRHEEKDGKLLGPRPWQKEIKTD